MDWKHLALSREARLTRKRARGLTREVVRATGALLLAGGWPRPLAEFLRERRLKGRLVLCKDDILYIAAGDCFLRFAAKAKPMGKLRREFAGWLKLRENGLTAIVQRSVELHEVGTGVILEANRLAPIACEEQLGATLPIIEALAAAARPKILSNLPATVDSGLHCARELAGGSLPASFAAEPDIHACFAKPLLIGVSHQDLHYRNIMREGDGRSVLIDLKSCGFDQVLALDWLTFACRYLAALNGLNVIEQARTAQLIGWRIADLDALFDHVDLPRSLWGPIFVLHAVGLVALKRGSDIGPNPLVRRSLSRILNQDWRSPAASDETATKLLRSAVGWR